MESPPVAVRETLTTYHNRPLFLLLQNLDPMLGAIMGDIIGSVYEFIQQIKGFLLVQ